jgi:hypothetical protein
MLVWRRDAVLVHGDDRVRAECRDRVSSRR